MPDAQTYLAVKTLHMSCAAISISLFVLRGAWMMQDSSWLQRRWVRVVPHMVDSVLLGSAIALAWILHQYPFVHGWLTAKVLALIAYILLGTIALKRGRTRGQRIAAFFAAVLTFGYIVAVARAHDPWPFALA